MARITDRNDWFVLWWEDQTAMLKTMLQNMVADLDAGYRYDGESITKQREEIRQKENYIDKQIETFKAMTESQVNRWCFYDLKKRGAIA